MNRYRFLYILFFLTALDLHSEEGEASFDVIVSCVGTVSITINVSQVDKVFSAQELVHDATKPNDILIGSFDIIVNVTTMDHFTISSYSDPLYVDENNYFHAPSNVAGKTPLKLFYFGNKNKDGETAETEMFNNSVIIENYTSTLPQLISLNIDIYMLSRQLEHLGGSTCYMPIKFNLAGV